ncbi:hypothetical protein MRBLWH7_000347 [Microbacterium sp. LWH7-1.2]|uniref:hypothetical protein n=1 Tax=Microbacterium sp. LWH7-1.2 TaxID=3135257 RepID=UPI00313892E5
MAIQNFHKVQRHDSIRSATLIDEEGFVVGTVAEVHHHAPASDLSFRTVADYEAWSAAVLRHFPNPLDGGN